MSKVKSGPDEVVFENDTEPCTVTVAPFAAEMVSVLPDGTLNAVMTTLEQDPRLDADATLLTVHVARFAISVPDGDGAATAKEASATRTKEVNAPVCMMKYQFKRQGERAGEG